jgi:phosphogluconate dehydratase
MNEKAIVNGIVGLLATGGSTNHTIHLVAIARAAGLVVTWDDFDELSHITPLIARIYPNGGGDVNQFQAAGGIGFVVRELLGAGLLHADAETVFGEGLGAYTKEPFLSGDGEVGWRDAPLDSRDNSIVRSVVEPFQPDGGLRLVTGNLGRGIGKTSAVAAEFRVTEAPARIFEDQDSLLAQFKAGALDRDMVAVVRFQGPRANGMPELHSLTPTLSVLQKRGYKVALVSDGRMSGASGAIPAAIHMTPEAVCEGPLARLRDGDIVRLDLDRGTLNAAVDPAEFASRRPATRDGSASTAGMGRELFANFRACVSAAESGALTLFDAAQV